MHSLLALGLAFSLMASSAPEVKSEGPFEKGIQLCEQGKHEECILQLEIALSRYPEGSNILWNLGLASAAAGQHEKALTFWKRYRKLESEDWEAIPKVIQAYQALGRADQRDEALAELLQLRKETQNLHLKEAPGFFREQFKVNDRLIMVYQFFEPKGEWMQFYRFIVINSQGKKDYYISLGSYEFTNQYSREAGHLKEGERVYHLDGYYKDGAHATFGMMRRKTFPEYDSIRSTVIKILNDEIKPASSSTRPKKTQP